jgi:hypothetical protein
LAGEERLRGHTFTLGICIEGIGIGEGQLQGFDCEVNRRGGVSAELLEIEPLDEAERLKQAGA